MKEQNRKRKRDGKVERKRNRIDAWSGYATSS